MRVENGKQLEELMQVATFTHPDYGPTRIRTSFSYITENGTRLTFDRRFSYYGDVILAEDWDRNPFSRHCC